MQPASFAPRVLVFSASGNLLYTVHAERAAKMRAEVRKRKGGHIREITISESAPHTHKPASVPTLRDYMGQRYTVKERTKNEVGEVDGIVCQFRWIHPGDRPLFRLSVTDCLVA